MPQRQIALPVLALRVSLDLLAKVAGRLEEMSTGRLTPRRRRATAGRAQGE